MGGASTSEHLTYAEAPSKSQSQAQGQAQSPLASSVLGKEERLDRSKMCVPVSSFVSCRPFW